MCFGKRRLRVFRMCNNILRNIIFIHASIHRHLNTRHFDTLEKKHSATNAFLPLRHFATNNMMPPDILLPTTFCNAMKNIHLATKTFCLQDIYPLKTFCHPDFLLPIFFFCHKQHFATQTLYNPDLSL